MNFVIRRILGYMRFPTKVPVTAEPVPQPLPYPPVNPGIWPRQTSEPIPPR